MLKSYAEISPKSLPILINFGHQNHTNSETPCKTIFWRLQVAIESPKVAVFIFWDPLLEFMQQNGSPFAVPFPALERLFVGLVL